MSIANTDGVCLSMLLAYLKATSTSRNWRSSNL